MAAEYRREYTIRLPLPLAQLYSRAHNAKSARDRHDLTYFLFEAAIRLAVAPLVLTYLHEVERGQPRSDVVSRGLMHLSRPSAGHWVGLLRELARYFGERVDAATHPLGHLWKQLNVAHRDLPGCLELYRRIKNGPDGSVAKDQAVALIHLLDALVPYRNRVIGHGGVRDAEFYESEVGPLLFPAVNDLLSENVFDLLGPAGSKLVSITDIHMVDKGRFEIGLREVTGLQGERCQPMTLSDVECAALVPNTLALLWPGRSVPLRLDPLLIYRDSELSDELWFLNSIVPRRFVEYLNYANSKTDQNRSMMTDLMALLTRISGRIVDDSELVRMSDQSQSESMAAGNVDFPIDAPTGRVVGDYELLAELGRGGMGIVYLARQTSLGRLLALKFLPPELQSNVVAVARFRREMRLLARCDDPRIIKIVACGTLPDGQPYYAMEYVPGCDLEQVWQRLARVPSPTRELSVSDWSHALVAAANERREQVANRSTGVVSGSPTVARPAPTTQKMEMPDWCRPLPMVTGGSEDAGGYVRRVVQLVCDAAEAVATLHAQGVIHRDIKPTNLMVPPDGSRVVLMDFGLAKGETTGLTREGSGDFLGTMRYAAPEQLAAANIVVGKPADVRALGIVLWELLTRRRLFAEAEDLRTLAPRVLNDDVPLLRSVDPTMSPDLEAIIARATERRVDDRIPDAATLASYLRMYLNGQTLPIRPPTLRELGWRWAKEHWEVVAITFLSLGVVIAITIGAFALVNHARRKAVELASNLAISNNELDIALAREKDQARQIKRESAKAFFASGNASYDAGRTDAGCIDLLRAWRYCDDDDPRKIGYERVLVDRLTRGARASLPFWHDSHITGVVVSPNGERIATSSYDGTSCVWDAKTGERLAKLQGHTGPVVAVKFSPDGSRIVTASEDHTARLWDVATGESIVTLIGHSGVVHLVLFSPDGSQVVTASHDRSVRLWNAATGQPLGSPIQLPSRVEAIDLSLDGTRLVTAEADGHARLWNITTNRQDGPPLRHDNVIVAVAFSSDGARIVTASTDKTARIWDAANSAPVGKPMVHDEPIVSMAISADGKKIVTGSWDQTARVWDALTGESLVEPLRHGDLVMAVAFSPDGSQVITGSQDRAARIWDIATGKLRGEPMWHAKWVGRVGFSPDGSRVVTGSGDHSARVWQVDDRPTIGPPLPHGGDILQLVFTSNNYRLLSSSTDMKIRSWEPNQGQLMFNPIEQGEPGFIPFLFFSSNPTGERLVAWTNDDSAQIWNANNGERIGAPLMHQESIAFAAVSDNGKLVATASEDKTARLWDLESGAPVGEALPHDDVVSEVKFSSDGKYLVTSSEDQHVRVWETKLGRLVGAPIHHASRDAITAPGMAISRDGRFVVTWVHEGEIRVWAMDRQKQWEAAQFEAEWSTSEPIAHVMLSDNQTRVVVIDQAMTCYVWDAATGKEIREPLPLPHANELILAAIDESGQLLVTAADDGSAQLWDVVTGAPLGHRWQHTSQVSAIAFRRDGQVAATGTDTGLGQVWSTRPLPAPRNKADWFGWLAHGERDSVEDGHAPVDVESLFQNLKQDAGWQKAMR